MTVQYSGGLHAAWLLNVRVCVWVMCYARACVCVYEMGECNKKKEAQLCNYQRQCLQRSTGNVVCCLSWWWVFYYYYLFISDEPRLALDSLRIWQECTGADLSLQIKAADPLWLSESERASWSAYLVLFPSVCLSGQVRSDQTPCRRVFESISPTGNKTGFQWNEGWRWM